VIGRDNSPNLTGSSRLKIRVLPTMIVTIVIPVYNGAATVGLLVRRLIDVLSMNALQIVLVNDGSPDNSAEVCRALHAAHPETATYVELAKNFGEHNAVMAGLRFARGEYVVIMDDDFQNPPEEVARLIEHASAHGYDVVYSDYPQKQHHWFRNLGSRLSGLVANFMLDKPRDLYLSSFKCLSRLAVKEIIKYQGPYPYIDGLALRCTRHVGTIQVQHQLRREGRSSYTLRKLVRLGLNMSVNFSVMPLRVSTVMGMTLSTLGFLWGVWLIVDRLLTPDLAVGWTPIVVTFIFFSGLQLLMVGLVGEYLGRLFLTSNQTPQSVVRVVLGTTELTGAGCQDRDAAALVNGEVHHA
jgi:undecaprenyl-phosphate 4-deoxy-4-formamido-L-arabinose transferase